MVPCVLFFCLGDYMFKVAIMFIECILENASVGIFYRELISDPYLLTILPRQKKSM